MKATTKTIIEPPTAPTKKDNFTLLEILQQEVKVNFSFLVAGIIAIIIGLLLGISFFISTDASLFGEDNSNTIAIDSTQQVLEDNTEKIIQNLNQQLLEKAQNEAAYRAENATLQNDLAQSQQLVEGLKSQQNELIKERMELLETLQYIVGASEESEKNHIYKTVIEEHFSKLINSPPTQNFNWHLGMSTEKKIEDLKTNIRTSLGGTGTEDSKKEDLCAVAINSPQTGDNISNISLVSGTANISKKDYFWVFTRMLPNAGMDNQLLADYIGLKPISHKLKEVSSTDTHKVWIAEIMDDAEWLGKELEIIACIIDGKSDTLLNQLIAFNKLEGKSNQVPLYLHSLNVCVVDQVTVRME